MSIIDTIHNTIMSAISKTYTIDMDEVHKKATKNVDRENENALSIVPQKFRGAVLEAAKNSDFSVPEIVQQISAENGGKWDPKLRGISDPTDYGITQLNPIAIKSITEPRAGGKSFFQQRYGEDFDIENPRHQILGLASVHNYNRQFALPEFGITTPTNQDIMYAYNLGAKGLSDYRAGKGDNERYAKYEANLKKGQGMIPVVKDDII